MLRRKGGDEGDYPGADYSCPESSPPRRTNPEWVPVLLVRPGRRTTRWAALLARRTIWLLIARLGKHADVLGWANKWL